MFRKLVNVWDRQSRSLPIIPPLPPYNPEDRPGNKAIAICGQCGRTVHQMEMYSCSQDRCPIQPRITF